MHRSRTTSRRLRIGARAAGVALGLALLAAVLPAGRDHSARRGPSAPAAPAPADLPVRRDARAAPLEDRAAIDLALQVPAPEPADPRPLLVVDVVDEEGRPTEDATVLSIDCPGFFGGPPGAYRVEPGPCLLRAARRDGALLARGAAASVEVRGPDPTYLQLELPSQRTGGIGIRFLPNRDGVEVVEVVPGTPAWEAGLQPGDAIVAIGGEEVAGKDSAWFVDRMTGAVGTEVEFTVGYDTDTGTARQVVRLTRVFLDL